MHFASRNGNTDSESEPVHIIAAPETFFTVTAKELVNWNLNDFDFDPPSCPPRRRFLRRAARADVPVTKTCLYDGRMEVMPRMWQLHCFEARLVPSPLTSAGHVRT